MPTNFIGIDLAWEIEKKHTGIAIMREAGSGVQLVDYSRDISSMKTIEAYLHNYIDTNTFIAIDAPLVIRNLDHQRQCEKEISREFGSRHASAYSSNLTHSPTGSLKLTDTLILSGFKHYAEPEIARRPGRWIFEVYPHAALVVLFKLDRIIKYKKGSIVQKRRGLQSLQTYIHTKLSAGTPALIGNEMLNELLEQNVQDLKGNALKRYEDTLDALICAYLAAYYWWWGGERNKCFGDLDTGYIINPTQPL